MTMQMLSLRQSTSVSAFMLRAWALLAVCIMAAAIAYWTRPTTEISMFQGKKLEQLIPIRFGEWQLDKLIVPINPDPSTLAAVNRIYSETLARTYVNSRGQRVMLSLAYGRRQNDTMRLHRPEGCYAGQGFAVRLLGAAQVEVGDRTMAVMRLDTSMSTRQEPVTYWMVVGGMHAIDQLQAKFAQLEFGIRGFIPDGLLFRVSSFDAVPSSGFALQDAFVRDLIAAVPAPIAQGLLGT